MPDPKDPAATNQAPAHGPSLVEPGSGTLAQVGGAVEPSGEPIVVEGLTVVRSINRSCIKSIFRSVVR